MVNIKIPKYRENLIFKFHIDISYLSIKYHNIWVNWLFFAHPLSPRSIILQVSDVISADQTSCFTCRAECFSFVCWDFHLSSSLKFNIDHPSCRGDLLTCGLPWSIAQEKPWFIKAALLSGSSAQTEDVRHFVTMTLWLYSHKRCQLTGWGSSCPFCNVHMEDEELKWMQCGACWAPCSDALEKSPTSRIFA